jgi:acyl-CoA reductase-like NAD-dependent aldehyde dehydrogenase
VNFSVREPVGVVARIIPFNHPFMFAAGKSAAPLAAGNSVIVKPPDQAPLSTLRLAELVADLLPPARSTCCRATARPARRSRRIRGVAMVAIIGSVAAGRAVMRAASDTLKPLMLELGGKNALIAYADADPDAVAARGRRRHELHLVRPVVRLDQPRVRARVDPRRRRRARQGAHRALSARACRPTRRRRWARS